MEFFLRSRTEEDTNEFLTWCYEGIYSFYDNNIQQEKIDGIINATHSDRAFSVINKEGELVGNCEFFNVSDDEDDEEEILAAGVQMKPSLTGKGFGTDFSKAIVQLGRERLHYDRIELAVVDFNKRAIRVYEKVGFLKKGEFENEIRGKNYRFIIMAKQFS